MIDSHAHVCFRQFDNDREEVIKRARKAGVEGWIEVGTDLEQSKKAIELAQHYASVWATAGVHPSEVVEVFGVAAPAPPAGGGEARNDKVRAVWEEFEGLLEERKVVAIGEVGLDFFRGGMPREQMPVLEKFVKLGLRHNLPLVWHMRSGGEWDANEMMLDFLEALPLRSRPRGVMHTFSGDERQAERYLVLGLYLGFSGVVTFKNAGVTAEVAKIVPLNRILIETDCPFLAPEPHRGERNEPAYVKNVADKIASLRKIAVEEVMLATETNTRQLFGVA